MSEPLEGEVLAASDGNVIPFRQAEAAPQPEHPEEDDSVSARGPELGSMRAILNCEKKVYRMCHRGEITSSECERRVKTLAVMFEQLKFMDFERDISERLLRLEESRGGMID